MSRRSLPSHSRHCILHPTIPQPLLWSFWQAGPTSSKALIQHVHFSHVPVEIQDFTMGAQQMLDEPHKELLRPMSPILVHQWPKTQGQSVQEWPLHTEVHPEADVPNDLCPACCSGKPRAGICGGEVMVVNPLEFGVTSAACNRPPRNKIRPLSGCYAHTQREKQWPGHLHRDEKGWIWLHQAFCFE